jgi:hypothetical protein
LRATLPLHDLEDAYALAASIVRRNGSKTRRTTLWVSARLDELETELRALL